MTCREWIAQSTRNIPCSNGLGHSVACSLLLPPPYHSSSLYPHPSISLSLSLSLDKHTFVMNQVTNTAWLLKYTKLSGGYIWARGWWLNLTDLLCSRRNEAGTGLSLTAHHYCCIRSNGFKEGWSDKEAAPWRLLSRPTGPRPKSNGSFAIQKKKKKSFGPYMSDWRVTVTLSCVPQWKSLIWLLDFGINGELAPDRGFDECVQEAACTAKVLFSTSHCELMHVADLESVLLLSPFTESAVRYLYFIGFWTYTRHVRHFEYSSPPYVAAPSGV